MTTYHNGLYWDFHWPLALRELLEEAIGRNKSSPNTPTVNSEPSVRQWLSQPRPNDDPTTDVISINFKLLLSVSEITFEALRVPVRIEVWYQDRLNNWRQALDRNHIPVGLTLTSSSSRDAWYKYHTTLTPIVAKSVQVRFTRVPDPAMGTAPYSVGLRNTLLRRNVYDRNDGRMPFEDEQDALGNVVAKYIKDWDAPKAIDDNAMTFWRSAPQPDHQAVVNLHLQTRNFDGSPQFIDTLAIDPVYTGQNLNIYYSNDETVGTRKLSPITLPPDEDVNTEWRSGRGRWDISTGPGGTSSYQFPLAIGHLVYDDVWIGMEWTPDFSAEEGPAGNPVLLAVTPGTDQQGQYAPKITYDSGAAEVVLTLSDGTDSKEYRVALSPLFVAGDPLRIVVGWRYEPDTVFISVRRRNGVELARLEDTDPDLPAYVTLDGSVGFSNFRGLFTSHIIKLEDYTEGAEDYLTNPSVYVSPDPVVPDNTGAIPSTTLDNAVYAVDWTLQTHGSGGTDESHYNEKTWTPIWRDYTTAKGKLYFPQAISMKYLKLEFTNLTEEPYPVYDVGVQSTYRVYPVSVQQTATQRHPGLLGVGLGVLELGAQLLLGAVGVGGVNWLNPSSVSKAVDAIFGQTVSPVTVTTGTPITYSELPASPTSDLIDTTRTEAANPYIYRRGSTDPAALAGNSLIELAGQWGQAIGHTSSVIANAIGDSFTPLVNYVRNPTALPVQGQDWWLFPGGTLALPAAIMNGLTAATQVVLGRKPTTETRIRFTTTSVHRYDTRTVTRDAALAYFAGVREVRALSTTYIAEQDPPAFEFSVYDPAKWVLTNVAQLDTGPITTAGKVYAVKNPGFDLDLTNWIVDPDQGWTRDGTQGRWHWGSLSVQADGTEKFAHSSLIDVTPGEPVTFSCWVRWTDLEAEDGEPVIVLGGTTFLDGEEVADVEIATIEFEDYTEHAYSFDPDEELEEEEEPTLSWVRLTGTWTPPDGVDQVRLRPSVTEHMAAGQAWFDTFGGVSAVDVTATAYKNFITTSTFSKVRCNFRDSGLVRSDAMWARADPNNTNIDNLKLAYYVTTIPDGMPSGTWADNFGTWADDQITWGSPRALVEISIDPNRIFDGRRALKMRRVSGAGEAGIKMVQQTNFVADALVRPCVVFYKPLANTNQITLRIRRVSDGVYIHEETIAKPAVGYWYTHEGQFVEVPPGDDQVYTLEVTTTGDAEDELYINDAYCELAHIRYFMRLGGAGEFLHDVTPLRYADSAQVVTTTPVNEVTVQAAILSPKAFAYSCDVLPAYLK
ncbi:minor tail protein [Mycobacterium phage Phrappuccino]|uniref:Minor tail protein n=1 Tax=Mycobacterium phage Phrappuccino TaxID=2591223 RepID=A0A514DDR4_9CAUD|nr:minor tail protein [Mycobacterium phage Phrappuccino]QDH91763.1 minor tail protein [Mycobacterium phage Phrappuccino]QIQ63205.1 minor tail protein [Mycobacterium phage Settecandela]